MYKKFTPNNLAILAFPCNQFGSQEPGTNAEIKQHIRTKYGVTFDLFAKIKVNGDDAIPLYKYLKKEQTGFITNSIKWNYTIFLINKEGKAVKRYGPSKDLTIVDSDVGKLIKNEEL